MSKIMIVPTKGTKLYNPFANRFVLPAGELVTQDKYWRGRVNDGGAYIKKAETKSKKKG